MNQDIFLAEIGTEELPSKMLRYIATDFVVNIKKEFNNNNINYDDINWFATPRRLAVKVIALNKMKQTDTVIIKRGPSVLQAFDNHGKPTKIAYIWADNCGININQAESRNGWLFYKYTTKNKAIDSLLCDVINNALINLKNYKFMSWNNKNISFIRPIHTVTILLNNKVIFGKILGITVDRVIKGHPFMGMLKININHAKDYPLILLKQGRVIADYIFRKELIRLNVQKAASKLDGIADISENLLDEITSLVEWPVILIARFKDRFLNMPIDIILYIMREYQKYFPIFSIKNKKILPNFIFVTNLESKYPEKIILGNEKVMNARLTDAEFFFKKDCKKRLEENLFALNTVLFQEKLGTLFDKSKRLELLSSWIANQIKTDNKKAARAGLLSKCDLVTNVVIEFTGIQGIMGMHYATYDGESKEIALAQKEQYYPRFSGDSLPTNNISCAVALANRIDTITGIFSINKLFKKNKDPFALRRAAIGILRIIIEKKFKLDLKLLTQESIKLYNYNLNIELSDLIVNFILERFLSWYHKNGYENKIIKSVLVCKSTKPLEIDAKICALDYFYKLKIAHKFIITNKRIYNIISDVDYLLNTEVILTILKEPAEINLVNKIFVLEKKIDKLTKKYSYKEALLELTTSIEFIENFFKEITVMDKNPEIKINRLTILNKTYKLFSQIADFSLLQ